MTNQLMRPNSFASFHGQAAAVTQLKVAVRSAKARNATLGHVLLTGPAGLGKSTLAGHVLPAELATSCTNLNCAGIEKPQQLLPILVSIKPGHILFLDEVHMLNVPLREHLLTVLEDRSIVIDLSEGVGKPKLTTIKLPEYTVVAATTRLGLLPETLRDRFKLQLRLELYDDVSMAEVVKWHAESRKLSLDAASVSKLVSASRGTARWAVRLLDAIIDTVYSQDNPSHQVTLAVTNATLSRLGFVNGLTQDEVRLLKALADAYGGRLGLSTLSSKIDEDQTTIEQVLEPWLIQQGYLTKEPNGRVISDLGRKILTDVH